MTESKTPQLLVVDDQPTNIKVLFETLRFAQYSVFAATNGEDALERARLVKPDLILLDIMMPGIDGFETITRLKQDPETASIPVIFMSALSETTDIVRGFALGAVDYITKPIRTEEVIARVKTQISLINYRQRLEQANAELEQKVKDRTADLIVALDKAESMNRLKSNFLANMSHELRTPLNAIIGLSSVVRESLLESQMEEDADLVERVVHAGERLKDTFNGILDLSLLETDQFNINLGQHTLDSIYHPIRKRYEKETAKKGLYFILDDDTEGYKIETDEYYLRQILDRIVNNAVKFTSHGGVTIKSTPHAIDGKDYVVIEITDTGIGIENSKMQVIFDEFRQVSEGLDRAHEGTGLGLTLASRMATLLKVRLEYESRVGEGTFFRLIVPAEHVVNEDELLATALGGFDQEPVDVPLILLVEDNESNKTLVSISLKKGFELYSASNGAEALELAKQIHFNLILMDINLGSNPDGTEIMKSLRSFDEYKHVPIIAATGYALPGDKEKFIEMGFTNYLAKPFTRAELIAAIEDALPFLKNKAN